MRVKLNVAVMASTLVVALIVGLLLIRGSSGSSSRSGQQIVTCLKAGASAGKYTVSTAQDDLDLIAEKAGDRAAKVAWAKNTATVVIERNASDAETTLKQYGIFKATLGGGPLTRTGAAVIAFDKTPTSAERQIIDKCVRR